MKTLEQIEELLSNHKCLIEEFQYLIDFEVENDDGETIQKPIAWALEDLDEDERLSKRDSTKLRKILLELGIYTEINKEEAEAGEHFSWNRRISPKTYFIMIGGKYCEFVGYGTGTDTEWNLK